MYKEKLTAFTSIEQCTVYFRPTAIKSIKKQDEFWGWTGLYHFRFIIWFCYNTYHVETTTELLANCQ